MLTRVSARERVRSSIEYFFFLTDRTDDRAAPAAIVARICGRLYCPNTQRINSACMASPDPDCAPG